MFTTTNGVLFQGDCLEILPKFSSSAIDCIFADPPFNLGKDYKNPFNDRIEETRYYRWCEKWISQCARILKPGGAFFLYALPRHAIHFGHLMNQCLTFRHWIALTMKGTYSRGKRLYPAHYALLYYTRGEPKTFHRVRIPVQTCRHRGKEIKDYGGHRNKLNPDGLNLTDFWEDTSPNRHEKFKVRPGVNELKLMIPERAVLISTEKGEVVLDPFGGGGSTFQAAEMHNRFWIGIELYDCKHVETRMRETFSLSAGREPLFDYRGVFSEYENYKNKVLRRGER